MTDLSTLVDAIERLTRVVGDLANRVEELAVSISDFDTRLRRREDVVPVMEDEYDASMELHVSVR